MNYYKKKLILSQFINVAYVYLPTICSNSKRDLAPAQTKEKILQNWQNRYKLRNNPDFTLPLVKSVYKSLKSLSYFGSKIWKILPVDIKETEPLLEFKLLKKRTWKIGSPDIALLPSLQSKFATCRTYLGQWPVWRIEFSVMRLFGASGQISTKLWVYSHFARNSLRRTLLFVLLDLLPWLYFAFTGLKHFYQHII